MENINQTMGRFINRWWKLPILVFSSLILGIFFLPADSVAQPVPPRSQTLQMIRPVEPQPELPLEKQIRRNREAIEATKAELARKIDRQATIAFLSEEKNTLQAKLNNLVQRPDSDVRIKAVMEDKACQNYRKSIQRILDKMKGWHDYDTIEKKVNTLRWVRQGAKADPEMLEFTDVMQAIRSNQPCIGPLTNFLNDIAGTIYMIEEDKIKLEKVKGGKR